MKKCDLHNHSTSSDGSYTPSQLVDYAIKKGLYAVALTDHNNIDGIKEFSEYAKDKSIEAVCGCEITTEIYTKEVHLLALFIKDVSCPSMVEFLQDRHLEKKKSNQDLEKNLLNGGYEISLEKMHQKYGKTINRAHFAKELILKGYVKTTREAFDTILKPNGEFFKPYNRPNLIDAVKLVYSWGATPVLAHPLLSLERQELEKALPYLKEAHLAGMEVYYPEFSEEDTAYLIGLCDKYDLIKSGGSDFHGDIKTNSDLALSTTDYENFIKLKNFK